MARRLVTSSMMSRDSDVIIVTLPFSKSAHSEIRTRSTIRADPFAYTIVEHCLKNQLKRLRSLEEDRGSFPKIRTLGTPSYSAGTRIETPKAPREVGCEEWEIFRFRM